MPSSSFPSRIVIDPTAGLTEQFAAEQLSAYLKKMLGLAIGVRRSRVAGAGTIHLRAQYRDARPRVPIRVEDETYTIDVRSDRVRLSGGAPRSALYAVYAFLEELGCRWFAPRFTFYRSIGAEHVPRLKSFSPTRGRRVTVPNLLYRETLLEECRTWTIDTVRTLIDWLPKVRSNILHAPSDYQHSGRFAWKDVRHALIPELRRRGLVIKVGGHGYENYLHPDDFFDEHPEWFALVKGKRSRDPHHVFETGNPQALRTFTRRVADYVAAHPEIDILSLWPPDIVTWGTSPESLAQGSPSRRQAIVTRATNRALKRRKLPVTLEIITYDQSEAYPENFAVDDDIIVIVDFYYQNHSGVLIDPATLLSGHTLEPLDEWTQRHKGPLSYFSYHRRYCWQSRPVVTPQILSADLRYIYDRGIRGLASFAEAGDWMTFELQHYIAAHLCENVATDIRRLVVDYCRHRFGAAGPAMEAYYWKLEKLATRCTTMLGASKITEGQLLRGEELLDDCRALLRRASRTKGLLKRQRTLLARMVIGLRHMAFSLALHRAENDRDRKGLEATIRRNLALIRRHRDLGLFVEPFWLTENHFMRIYGTTVMSTMEKAQRWKALIDSI